jgi:CheY-like chemotaxis protein
MKLQARKSRILFGEDHEDTCELLTLIFGSNYEVSTAPDISSALKLTENKKFDLFVLDSQLADGSGVELCKRAQPEGENTMIRLSNLVIALLTFVLISFASLTVKADSLVLYGRPLQRC